jgi:hypothetical protein
MSDGATVPMDTAPTRLPRAKMIRAAAVHLVPALIADAGDAAAWHYMEFFTASIRNPHTRRAYAQACSRFFAWCEERGLTLTTIRAFDVAAWVEQLQQTHSASGAEQPPVRGSGLSRAVCRALRNTRHRAGSARYDLHRTAATHVGRVWRDRHRTRSVPHNARTTTIEALWQGVPVVSLAGRPSVGRFGAFEPLALVGLRPPAADASTAHPS